MTQTNNFTTQPTHPASLGKRMLQGAAIGLILISVFLIAAGAGNPAWGKFWMIRPLMVVPLAGATGAAFYHLMDRFRYQSTLQTVGINFLCLLVFIVGLWLGTVLGLAGTMWN